MKPKFAIALLFCLAASTVWSQTTDTLDQVTTNTLLSTDTLLTSGSQVTIGPSEITSPTVVTTTTLPVDIDELTSPPLPTTPDAQLTTSMLAYDFTPPLSIKDADDILLAGIELIELSQEGMHELERAKLQSALELVRNYIELLDQRYSTLWDYQWIPISEEYVAKAKVNVIEFRPLPPLLNVSAIGLEVLDADLIVELLAVWDEDAEQARFESSSPIQHGLPRKVVHFLLAPNITVAKVIATAKTVDENRSARLVLYAGITPEPEYAKYALRQINTALLFINNQQDAEAIQRLNNVRGYLESFKVQQGLDRATIHDSLFLN